MTQRQHSRFIATSLDLRSPFKGSATIYSLASCAGAAAMIMLKYVGVDPLPNYQREPAARWDAYLYVPDPDALAAEFASRNVEFSEPLKDTHDGLRGFELKDCDGYVLFFGRPRS